MAQIPDVFGAINKQPAINRGICKPPKGLDGQKKAGGIRTKRRSQRGSQEREEELGREKRATIYKGNRNRKLKTRNDDK